MDSQKVIYKIFNSNKNLTYIGATKNFSLRKSTHSTNIKNNKKNLRLYKIIDNPKEWKIEIIEKCPADISTDELYKKEQEYIDNHLKTGAGLLNKKIGKCNDKKSYYQEYSKKK